MNTEWCTQTMFDDVVAEKTNNNNNNTPSRHNTDEGDDQNHDDSAPNANDTTSGVRRSARLMSKQLAQKKKIKKRINIKVADNYDFSMDGMMSVYDGSAPDMTEQDFKDNPDSFNPAQVNCNIRKSPEFVVIYLILYQSNTKTHYKKRKS